MRTAAFSLLVTLPAFVVASDVVTIGSTGGWHDAEVTEENTKILSSALTGDSYDKSVGDTRVCYEQVTAVESQVVAGTNYRFHISGCDVTDSDGECSKDTLSVCSPSEFVVQVFQQTWTNTLKVTKITGAAASSSTGNVEVGSTDEAKLAEVGMHLEHLEAVELSDDEKQAIEAWIDANGLNKYGDEATRMYLGGTPLFDESTGITMNRFEYILSRHPDRPWQAKAEIAMLLATTETESKTQGRGSMAGVFAMLGVFTVVLAGVAVLKMHRGRRANRFRYNPIENRDQ
ncbi:hypothetical protein JM18_007345 [Phytophthora kernoviae]|uniref:Cystatin domain-containing protein n=2 Tax=Phytophthora kernoviae TaxID=325452 RepID=A0A8T0LPW5_9STRA|nr:hypothetical protein G195_008791 [Phytophthora kernoviae 00238/432]KAG2517346.1 hypothetical protein JM16_007456 [Phytophthora kernoviae]KAG2519950.1 hypothetical protein JM18_007345 [Phytophthora kernoviae]